MARGELIKGLYAIIDSAYVPMEKTGEAAKLLIKGGACIIQLRAKDISPKETLRAAREIRGISSEAGALFIVNDRVDLALACGADGIHLGQEDIPLRDARKLLGDKAVIGISTHDPQEAFEAQGNGADYISFGPIFPTATKKDARSPRGLEYLSEITKKVSIPVAAIGGITEENIASVIRAGASSVAIISDILTNPDIPSKVRSIISCIAASRVDPPA